MRLACEVEREMDGWIVEAEEIVRVVGVRGILKLKGW